jgi:hypothetical protein
MAAGFMRELVLRETTKVPSPGLVTRPCAILAPALTRADETVPQSDVLF